MRSPPEGFDESAMTAALAAEWGFDAVTVDYHPEGFGSYHWIVADADGARRFVTVDDLDAKSWLGSTRTAVFDGLRRAFDTAFALRHQARLAFVLAPLLSRSDATVIRTDDRYAVAVYPIAAGRSVAFGQRPTPADRVGIIGSLAKLHRATRFVETTASSAGFAVPGRIHLDHALATVDDRWDGGPFAEPARAALRRNRDDLARLLEVFDGLAAELAAAAGAVVITHGEPHEANIMRDGLSLVLIDWDTVALALPERDLWIIDGITDAEITRYEESTSRRVDPRAMDLYRLRWDLADIAEYIRVLRAPHDRTADTEHAAEMLDHYVHVEARWAAFLR